MELRNESGLLFTDISSEVRRSYHYPGGQVLTIEGPQFLHVSKSGGHRLLDEAGQSWYVAPGWRAINWIAKDDKPHFVK